jgi:hypothetical protein
MIGVLSDRSTPMRLFVRLSALAASLLAMTVAIAGCNSDGAGDAGKMSGGAMEKTDTGKMSDGAMDKMDTGKMSGGAMDKMDTGKMSGGAMDKMESGKMDTGKMSGEKK